MVARRVNAKVEDRVGVGRVGEHWSENAVPHACLCSVDEELRTESKPVMLASVQRIPKERITKRMSVKKALMPIVIVMRCCCFACASFCAWLLGVCKEQHLEKSACRTRSSQVVDPGALPALNLRDPTGSCAFDVVW